MILQPERIDNLGPEQYEAIMKRSRVDIVSVYDRVREIVYRVRDMGEGVFFDYYKERYKPDMTLADLEVKESEIERAYKKLDQKVIDALRFATKNITKFHKAQLQTDMWMIDVADGVLAGRMTVPIERVGAYIPGGKAIYPSSVLMTILPARVAGVREIVVCTPPHEDMTINPAILVAADICGPVRIFKVGGPWAIAAMAYGTKSIPRVDKIVGPGNKFVTAAKTLVFGEVGIDSPAGPSEGVIISDDTGDANLITIDLLSQAEHDPDSAVLLITTSEKLALKVSDIVNSSIEKLHRKDILLSSLKKHSSILIAKDMEQAVDFVNDYAPEHLEIITADPFFLLKKIRNAGSIFLGPYSPIPAGDYASGTNHVLPTARTARMFSGLSVDDFIKKPTFQYVSKEGLSLLKDAVITLAEAEGLFLHAESIKARFR
jgi:histidinol dehydrogenase